MCGIFCVCSKDDEFPLEFEKCVPNIRRRGPDFVNTTHATYNNYKLNFIASVLWLQGTKLTRQPINTNRSIFIYNGDVYDGLMNEEDRVKCGDTDLLVKHLEESCSISETFSKVRGPYAFVYYDKQRAKLYFGRDVLGRKSLIIGKRRGSVLLTSVASKNIECNCIELPAIGLFCLNLNNGEFILYPWQYRNDNFTMKFNELQKFLDVNINLVQHLPLLNKPIFCGPTLCDLKDFEQIRCFNGEICFENLLGTDIWDKNVLSLCNLLNTSVKKRVSNLPKFCKLCISDRANCDHCLVGVLFSGGLDCTILALLADKFIGANHPIDLFNVAFSKNFNFNTPDRITGSSSYEELKALRPRRKWNFVEIDVTIDELDFEREKHIKHLIYPLNTVLDDSLGCALWFASKGENSSYKSPCRVLLTGTGADELFGGYTRHRAALTKRGWESLHNALEEDWQNISHRNLARDDRVASDHGRQLRMPYLDEDVVDFVRSLNCWEKTFPSKELAHGVGEKILLRCLAYYLGLRNVTTFKKRALQFGSRIANNKECGHNISVRL